MLMSILSHTLSAWFAFLLPCYSTFKALSHRPLHETELSRWSMYWTVIGAFVAFEYLAEWLVSWLPFYWEIKTLFLLFLSLPQTQGSTFIYNTYLQPFFVKNEADFDAGIISIQRTGLIFLKTRLTTVWDLAWSAINKTSTTEQPQASGAGQPASSGAPVLSLQSAMSLWGTYGSSVINAFHSPSKGLDTSAGSFQSTSAEPSAVPPPADTPSAPLSHPESQHP